MQIKYCQCIEPFENVHFSRNDRNPARAACGGKKLTFILGSSVMKSLNSECKLLVTMQ